MGILEEIVRNDPDVVTMEECDQFEFYLHYLSPLGFKGVFNPKSSSPCVKIAKANGIQLNADGVAIFYRSNTLTVSDQQILKFGKKIENIQDIDVPAMSMVLTHQKTKKSFLIAVAHLKSTKDQNGEMIRLNQLQHLLPKLQDQKVPIFMGCDLNTSDGETYSVVYDSICFPDKLNPNDKDKPKMAKGYKSGYGLKLSSAYFESAIPEMELAAKAEPVFTTFKKRSGGVVKHTIDYIFYQKEYAKVADY